MTAIHQYACHCVGRDVILGWGNAMCTGDHMVQHTQAGRQAGECAAEQIPAL